MTTYQFLSYLCDLADMYADICTKQQEKFNDWKRIGYPYRWSDCQAAYEMLKETGRYFDYYYAWRNGKLADLM